MNCTACHDLLLDYLYDLLDESQAIAVREHVAACPACASDLDRARSDQLKLGRAALAILQVPEFEMPEATELAPAEVSPAPVAAPPAPRRAWPTTVAAALVALACCVLVAVLFRWNDYQDTLRAQIGQVAKLNQEHLDITTQLAALDSSFAREQKTLRAEADAAGVQLHVAGPGRGVPQVSAPINVALVNLEGKPVAGKVDVEFVDAQKRTLARRSVQVNGAADVAMPGELSETDNNITLRFAAEVAGKQVATLEQMIAPPPQERAAHVAVNKLVYKAGDRVLVRALVLNRATLKPTPDGSKVRAAIVSETGQDVVSSPLLTTLAGMASGELALPADLAGGDYSVEVRGDDLIPVRRRIDVFPAAAPTVDVLTQQNNRYLPNKAIDIQLRALNADGSPAANAAITGNYYSNDRGDRNLDNKAKQATEFQAKTDKDGRFNVVLPPTQELANGQQVEFNVAVGDAKKEMARARYMLQMQPTRVAVDFYPEGGTLVAGVPNKVFFRVRAAESDAPASARIEIRAGGASVYRSLAEESLGAFDVTPKLKEGLTVQFPSPKQPDQRVPYEAIGIAKGGVIIRGLAVQTGGGPVRLSLENRGEPRLVQLVVTCRSEVVAHRRLELKGEQSLDLPVTVDGVLRVTAFHVQDGDLVPLAERLIYRAPVRRLDLDVQVGAKLKKLPAPVVPFAEPIDAFADAAGRTDGPLHLNIRGKNESGDTLPFWALASIVDDRFLDGPEPSLAAHFLLLGDDADWSDSPLLGLDSPAYRSALENALGVFGWRRLAEPDGQFGALAPMAKAAEKKLMVGAAKIDPTGAGEAAKTTVRAKGPTATFFYRVAPGLEELRKKLDNDWTLAQLALTNASKKRQAELLREEESVRGALAVAQRELQVLEDLPREWLMFTLGAATFGLMIVGSLGIVFGLVQLARQHAASPAFCLAAGSLAACLAILMFRPDFSPRPEVVMVASAPTPSEFVDAKRPNAIGESRQMAIANGHAQLEPKQRERLELAAHDDRAGRGADARNKARAYIAQKPADELMVRNEQAKGSLPQILRDAEREQMPIANAARSANVTLQNLAATAAPAMAGFGQNFAAPAQAPLGGGGGSGAPGPVVQLPPSAQPQFPGGMSGIDVRKGPGQAPGVAKVAEGAPVAPPKADADRVPPRAPQPSEPNRDQSVDVARLAEKLGQHRTVDLNALKRQFASRRSQDVSDPVTVLWNPALSVPAAGASLPLDLPVGTPRFRVIVFGHTDDGRLGLYDGLLEVTSERK